MVNRMDEPGRTTETRNYSSMIGIIIGGVVVLGILFYLFSGGANDRVQVNSTPPSPTLPAPQQPQPTTTAPQTPAPTAPATAPQTQQTPPAATVPQRPSDPPSTTAPGTPSVPPAGGNP